MMTTQEIIIMPRDFASDLLDALFAIDGGSLLHVVQDCENGELYSFRGESVYHTRYDLREFLQEWADRGTGRYEEEA